MNTGNLKKQKNIKLFLSIFMLSIFMLSPLKANALKQAIFPDGKSLQPMPEGVHANISGNTNSTTETSIPPQKENFDVAGSTKDASQTDTGDKKHSTKTYITFFLLLGLIISAVFTVYRKIHAKSIK